jgi:hypothetical protein
VSDAEGQKEAMMQETSTSSPEHRSKLILASRVLNKPVFSKDGERLGHVDDISIERVSGRSIYGIMSFGGLLGIGERYHPLPWEMLDFDPERGGFVIPMGRDELDQAPHYTRAELEALGGEHRSRDDEAILEYYARYGVLPY